jgi:hypothetical protein
MNALATLTDENKSQVTLGRRMGGNQAYHEKKSWNQIPDSPQLVIAHFEFSTYGL